MRRRPKRRFRQWRNRKLQAHQRERSFSRPSRRREISNARTVHGQGFATPRQNQALLTAAGRSAGRINATGGSGGKTTTACRVRHNYDLPAIHRPFLAFPVTAPGRFISPCNLRRVSRPAGLLKVNLHGRRFAVSANGCLVALMRWPNPQQIEKGKLFSNSSDLPRRFRKLFQVQGKFCFRLTSPIMDVTGVNSPAAEASLKFPLGRFL